MENRTVTCKKNNKIRALSNTLHTNKFKMHLKPKCKAKNNKTLGGKHRQITL